MPILTDEQINKGYFDIIGGFPVDKDRNILVELNEYNGEERVCIACTQRDGYSTRDKKRILNEWIDFLQTNTKGIKALHFNSHVPQALFNAACAQENLEELRFKWGNYKDLSALENLHLLKFLYIGSGSGVLDIEPLQRMQSLVVLVVENFKKVEDFSPLASLENLEQLGIWASILQRIAVKDLEFLRDMPNLRSFSTGAVTFRKKYSQTELHELFSSLPNLQNAFVNGKVI